MLDAVAEFKPLYNFGRAVLSVKPAPFLLGGEHQLVRHGKGGLSAEAAFGLLGSMPNCGKSAFNGIRGSDVFPMLGREVAEGQQIVAILDQAFYDALVFHTVSFDEEVEGGFSNGLGLGHPDIFQVSLGLRLHGLWHWIQHIRRLVDLLPGSRNAVSMRGQHRWTRVLP